jgi:hypothetical protein
MIDANVEVDQEVTVETGRNNNIITKTRVIII